MAKRKRPTPAEEAAAAAKKKAARKKAPVFVKKLPKDYIKGKPILGGEYTAWQTKNKEKPTFGKGNGGPGTPYREVKKRMGWNLMHPDPVVPKKPGQRRPEADGGWDFRNGSVAGRRFGVDMDAKSKAIARRLGNG